LFGHTTIVGVATLNDIADALAVVPERELRSLWADVENCPHLTPGLLAWLEAAVDWELHRRRGFLYHLLGPTAAIDDTECDASLAALAVLAGRCRLDVRRDVGLVADFLDLAAALLRDEVERA
jgi:hypothetical protein